MAILVMCTNPACGELFDAPDSAAGGEVHCPTCGTAQSLAAAPGAAAATGAAAAQGPSAPAPAKGSPPAGAPAGKPAPTPPPAAPNKGEVELDVVELALDDARTDRQQAAASAARSAPAAPAAPHAAPAHAKPAAPKAPAAPIPDPADEILFETQPTKGIASRRPDKAPAPPAKPPAGLDAPGFADAGRAQLESLRREGPPPATLQAELEDAVWTAEPADDAQADGAGAGRAAAANDSVLGHRPATAMIFVLGLVGLGTGLAAGIKLFPEQLVLAAYVGAGVGWMGGFTFGTLLVLGAEQAGGKSRCPVCHTEYPADAVECAVCGCQSLGPAPDPLAIECLHAGSYAVSNPSGLLPPVALGVLATGMVSAFLELQSAYPKESAQWAPFFIGLGVLAIYVVFSNWMAFLLSAAAPPPAHVNLPRKAPKAPHVASIDTLGAGLWGLAALAVYVGPLVTIPLLPMAMLMLSGPGRNQALNPLRGARAVWRHLKGFVVLWMFLMMWLAGGVLAGVLVKVLYDVRLSLPHVGGFAEGALRVMLAGFAAAAFGVVAAIFGLAMFRCLCAFGKYNASALPRGSAGSRSG
jgi:hypothetical protein